MNEIILIIFIIVFNLILFNISIKIANKFGLYDIPDFSRKIHKTKVPLVGGIIFLTNIILYLIYCLFFEKDYSFFSSNRELIGFYIGSIIIFIIGLYDDKFVIKPNSKLILLSLLAIITVTISESYNVKELKFLFIDKIFYLEGFSIIFTIFCYLVFLNAYNMMDGINGLSGTYFIICLIYLFFLNPNIIFFSFLIISGTLFLFQNFLNKIFLGDSGSLLLGFILSCLFIKYYNESMIYADQIVLLMILPGIDMLRVATTRLVNKKHAFEPDQSHIHHLLLKKYNYNLSYIIISGIILLSAINSLLISNNYINIIQIIIIITLYFGFIAFNKSN